MVIGEKLGFVLRSFQGFTDQVDQYLGRLLDPACISYRPRSEMEEDPSYKQLIPYVLFRYTDEAGVVHLFQYTRGKGQGEKRLHSKRSVGIGGHISSVDAAVDSNSDPYQEGMRRELEEEVIIDTAYTVNCVGMINDDLTEVGKVHLGVVHLFDVERPAVQSREDEIREAGFRPVTELMGQLDEFESWSEICLQALFAAEPQ